MVARYLLSFCTLQMQIKGGEAGLLPFWAVTTTNPLGKPNFVHFMDFSTGYLLHDGYTKAQTALYDDSTFVLR